MKNHSFAQIFKAEVEVVQWRAEDVFAELLTGFGGARYPHSRRDTHIRGATHITPTARVKYQVRYALGRGATHIATEPKKFRFLRPASYHNGSFNLQVGF